MDHLNELIAENLKDIRKGKGLSLEQVSSLTTISKSMLSQLERGEVNPTISTVYKLALGLKGTGNGIYRRQTAAVLSEPGRKK